MSRVPIENPGSHEQWGRAQGNTQDQEFTFSGWFLRTETPQRHSRTGRNERKSGSGSGCQQLRIQIKFLMFTVPKSAILRVCVGNEERRLLERSRRGASRVTGEEAILPGHLAFEAFL